MQKDTEIIQIGQLNSLCVSYFCTFTRVKWYDDMNSVTPRTAVIYMNYNIMYKKTWDDQQLNIYKLVTKRPYSFTWTVMDLGRTDPSQFPFAVDLQTRQCERDVHIARCKLISSMSKGISGRYHSTIERYIKTACDFSTQLWTCHLKAWPKCDCDVFSRVLTSQTCLVYKLYNTNLLKFD